MSNNEEAIAANVPDDLHLIDSKNTSSDSEPVVTMEKTASNDNVRVEGSPRSKSSKSPNKTSLEDLNTLEQKTAFNDNVRLEESPQSRSFKSRNRASSEDVNTLEAKTASNDNVRLEESPQNKRSKSPNKTSLEDVNTLERKSDENKVERFPKPSPGSLEEKVSGLDWKVNRKNIVLEMLNVTPPPELQSKQENGTMLVGEYLISDTKIGETYIATIYSCRNQFGTRFSAKVVDMSKIGSVYRDMVTKKGFRVLWLARKSGFKHLVDVHDVFTTNNKLIIVEEASQHPLGAIIAQVGSVKAKEARMLGEGLANAIFFLHNAGVVHQNISTWSVFVNAERTAKLGALEYAMVYYDPDKDEVKKQKVKGSVPQVGFLPPEIYTAETYDPTMVDVYSYGAVLCFVTIGHYPIVTKKAESAEHQLKLAIDELVSTRIEHMTDLVERCLKVNPTERPSIREVVEHPWFCDSLS